MTSSSNTILHIIVWRRDSSSTLHMEQVVTMVMPLFYLNPFIINELYTILHNKVK